MTPLSHLDRKEWALEELDLRRAEDARFPVDPPYGHPDRPDFNRMRRERHKRRKAAGYTRAEAKALVEWAKQMVTA